jgi:ribosomal protein S6--L-glutamate ligase
MHQKPPLYGGPAEQHRNAHLAPVRQGDERQPSKRSDREVGFHDAAGFGQAAGILDLLDPVQRQFEMMGVWPLNESVAIGRSRDKLRSLQLLARDGIGLPVTAFAHDTRQTDEVIEIAGGAPVVIKLLEGTQGIGVVLGETHMSAKSVVEAFRGVNVNILVQQYIQEAAGTDIRAFVVGGKVVAAMERYGSGDFRSNLHRGGSARGVRITPSERSTAIRAAHSMGLNVAGVDMLRSREGPVVMEVNSSPGLEGIEAATGIDIADRIIAFLERHARPGRTRTKGKG